MENKTHQIEKEIKEELTDISQSDQDIITMISEVRDQCRYLSIYTDTIYTESDKTPILRMTFGGSVRGYRYIFENIENRKNRLFISIFEVLKRVVPAEFFIDFIEDGVMDNYTTIEITKETIGNIVPYAHPTCTTDLDIGNMDSLRSISELTKLDMEKCFDFVSITVNFENMSRIITQQLTRHRNGITQESQRYVDYSESVFNSPAKFKDKYDPEKMYDTPIGLFNMSELGNTLVSIYRYLVDQGVDKEDARAYLPQNVQCGKVFMTFNLRTLFVFLNLRLDSHAQAEIRQYAEKLADLTDSYACELDIADMRSAAEYYSEPIYKRDQNNDLYSNIDEEV